MVVVHDNQTASWQASSLQAVSAPSIVHSVDAVTPWSVRRLVLYENICDVAIDDVSYYRPTAALRVRNAPFNAFFFQTTLRSDSQVVVLCVLQIIAKRDLNWPGARAHLRPNNDSDRNSTLDFDTIGQLRERADRGGGQIYPRRPPRTSRGSSLFTVRRGWSRRDGGVYEHNG